MPQIDVHARSHAPPHRVWSLLADTRSWADWAPLDEITVQSGHDVGELRRVRSGPITTVERVTALEPPRRYVYEIVSGLPIRGYLGEVLLAPTTEDGTDIHWRSTFQARVPGTGWALQRLIRRTIRKGAAALARTAEERP
jgi:uncharacterized protein YndB with AHSA1/START domain